MYTLAETLDYTFYTSVLGNYDYMFQDDSVLVHPSSIITDFSQDLVGPDFPVPFTFPSDSSPAVNT